MGLYLLIAGVFIATCITLIVIFAEGDITFIVISVLVGIFLPLLIIAMIPESETYTVESNQVLEVHAITNESGITEYVFNDGDHYPKLSDVNFSFILEDGDKMTVRKIVKFQPRSFLHFKSRETEYILSLPARTK